MAAELHRYDLSWSADVIHGNDWFCGLIPAYMMPQGRRPAHVITIHNLLYQGVFPSKILPELELAGAAANETAYYGQASFLRAGLACADRITTVSPTYAREIRAQEHGCGMHDLLEARAASLSGILNGMDNVVWNPACDPHIKAVYNAQCLQARHYNRTALLSEFGLMVPSSMPIFGIISRLSHEKGLDLLRRAIWPLLRQGAGLIVLGTGARSLERQFRRMACMWPGQVGLYLGFDEKLAHRILGGTDAVIIPSRMEPCGLVQMYAQRYGALPVVRRTGGLADSVCAETGFLFDRPESDDMQQALQSVIDMYACKDQWLYMQQAAMRKHYCWRQAADKYIAVYNTAMRRGA
jgi:starch synthase